MLTPLLVCVQWYKFYRNMRILRNRLRKLFFITTLIFMVPRTIYAAGDIEELNYFLAAIMTVPRGLEQWISGLFWFVISLCFGYIIVALSVVVFSDINTSKRKLYKRQISFLAMGSVLFLGISIYFGLVFLVVPYTFLSIIFIGIGLWCSIKDMKKNERIDVDDIEL